MATTITVEPDTLEEFNEMKQRYATNGRASANGFVNHLMDVYEQAHNNHTQNNKNECECLSRSEVEEIVREQTGRVLEDALR